MLAMAFLIFLTLHLKNQQMSKGNNLADSGTFHRSSLGLSKHLNLDTNNAFYTDEVTGLSVQSIAASGDDYFIVTLASGDDLSKIVKFSTLVLVNTTVSSGKSNDGEFEIESVNDTAKTIRYYNPNGFAQAGVGGSASVVPHQGAYYMKVLEDSTTFTSLVENSDYIGGDEDMLEGLTLDKGDQEFGFFTEIVPSAGKVRVAIF